MKKRVLLTSSGLMVASLAPQACYCFGGATLVSTRDGRRRIDSLAVGDEVFSWSRDGGMSTQPILRVYRHSPREVFQLGDSPVSRVTANHPVFRASTNDFTAAGELREGDELLQLSTGGLRTRLVHGAELPPFSVEPVFNLQVARTETYFADGILVHNKSPDPCAHETDSEYCRLDDEPSESNDDIVLPGGETGGRAPVYFPASGGSPGGAGGLGGSGR